MERKPGIHELFDTAEIGPVVNQTCKPNLPAGLFLACFAAETFEPKCCLTIKLQHVPGSMCITAALPP